MESNSLLSFSLPASCTEAELVQEIAKRLHWSVEDPLPEPLKGVSLPRGRAVFAPADSVLDGIVELHNLDWIVKDGVLRFTTKVQRGKRALSIALPPISPEFSGYRESENQRQHQLANVETLIDNLSQSVVRWLLDNPAAKERPYFFALQERLAELNEILMRLVRRQSLTSDGEKWSATRIEVLSLLKLVDQSDVVMAGLPKKLPGDRIEKLRKRKISARVRGQKIPTLHEFRYEIGTLTQKRAAEYLGCDPRTIRNYLQKGELTKARGGKVSCDDKWVRKIRAKYPAVQLQ
jgi:hypothetical protein